MLHGTRLNCLAAVELFDPADGPRNDDAAFQVADGDIVSEEIAGQRRIGLRIHYRRLNAFLGHYFKRFRRGATFTLNAPIETRRGELVDVEIVIDGYAPFVLHAEVVSVRQQTFQVRAELRLLTGPLADRRVAPLITQVLGLRHANALLMELRA